MQLICFWLRKLKRRRRRSPKPQSKLTERTTSTSLVMRRVEEWAMTMMILYSASPPRIICLCTDISFGLQQTTMPCCWVSSFCGTVGQDSNQSVLVLCETGSVECWRQVLARRAMLDTQLLYGTKQWSCPKAKTKTLYLKVTLCLFLLLFASVCRDISHGPVSFSFFFFCVPSCISGFCVPSYMSGLPAIILGSQLHVWVVGSQLYVWVLGSQLYVWGSPFLVRFLCMWPFFFSPFHLYGWCMLAVFSVAGIDLSTTWMSVWWNAYVRWLDLGLFSCVKEF